MSKKILFYQHLCQISQQKKEVAILTIFLLTTIPRIAKTIRIEMLQHVLYIRYPVFFCQSKISAFINSNNEENSITPMYINKLDL